MSTLGKSLQGQSGFSLIELLVVIAIISVVASLALMQRGSANEQFQRQNAARELKVAFERARFDSVKRRAIAPINVGDPDLRAYVEIFPTSFVLRTDSNQDGILDTADDQSYPFPTGIVATGYDFSIGVGESRKVMFNQRGEASMTSDNPQFMICNGTCPTAPGTSDVSNTVLVTPTGTVNILGGGVPIEDFANVTGQDPISNSSGIRPDVVIP
jgi:prepilin-type N-terminal cleavage/methylation domain-containing protein